MNTQARPTLAAGISPARAICPIVSGWQCSNAAADSMPMVGFERVIIFLFVQS